MTAPAHSSDARALTFRWVSVAALTLFLGGAGSQYLFAQAGNSGGEESYTISGTVVNSVTHAPVGRALVFSQGNRLARLTDNQGHFEFKIQRPPQEEGPTSQTVTPTFSDLSPMMSRTPITNVFLMARKPGYFQSGGQQPTLDSDSTTSSKITISLVPESLIIGHVNLAVNDGTDKIQVQIYRRQVQEGHAKWVSVNVVTTRANGDFRFANLQEGDYKLFTQDQLDLDPLTLNPFGQLFGYPPVYYPSAANFETGAKIHLKAGETFSATLVPSRRQYYRVKLNVQNAPMGGGISINVEAQSHPGPGYSLGYNANENTIVGMLPSGTYSVEVTKFGEGGSTGTVNLSVNGAPVEGPSVMLAPNSAVELHVTDERTNSDNTIAGGVRNLLNSMNLELVPSNEFGRVSMVRLQPPKGPEDESLVLGDIQPASYRVRTTCNPFSYVAEATSGGINLLRQPLVVGFGAAIAPIEITVRDDGAKVQGSIEGWPAPQPGQSTVFSPESSPTVVLLPAADNPGQFCKSWISPQGDFHFSQVPPGEYRVLAFDRLPENLEYEDPEAMQKYESSGEVLELVAGQNEHVRIALIKENE
ncbi:MAG: hypothetical protein WBE13_23290 [Candidatus Acidiferrum sp.]